MSFLGHPSSVPEQRFDHPLEFGNQLVAVESGRVDNSIEKSEVLGHRIEVGVVGQSAKISQRTELANRVVHGGADQEPDERQATFLAHPPGDPKVEQGGSAVGHHIEISAVKIAVKDAVDQCAFHEADHPGSHDGVGVNALLAVGLYIVETETVEAFHDQYPSGHERWVGTRDDELALIEFGKDPSDVEHVGGLDPKVEFLTDGLGKNFDEGGRIGQRRHRDAPNQMGGEPSHHREVLMHQTVDGRALNLHHDWRTITQRCRVHLGNRSSGDRGSFKSRKRRFERGAKILFDNLANRGEGLGGYLVSALDELGHQLGRKDALARRNDLTQLYVSGSESLGRFAQSTRQVGGRLAAAAPTPGHRPSSNGEAETAKNCERAAPWRKAGRCDQ